MEIKIEHPLGISKTGKRENNEDALYPQPGNQNQQSTLFLVCDGVGGSSRGEVASHITCNEIAQYFDKNNVVASDKETVTRAVEQAENAIDAYLAENPSAHGMATTLTLLHLNKNGATVAWCGDSRVYQIRGNDIVFKTIDHSYVNDLLKAGVITPDEAKDHPEKDVIMRAIQGALVKKAKVDAVVLDNVRKNDLFFLCSDGVMEALSEDELVNILADDNDLNTQMQSIDQACQEKSKDNYTCYLVKIASVKGKPAIKESIPTAKTVARKKNTVRNSKTTKTLQNSNKGEKKTFKKRNRVYLSIIAFSILASLSLFFLLPNEKSTERKTTSEQTTTTEESERTTREAENATGKADETLEEQQINHEPIDSEKLPEATIPSRNELSSQPVPDNPEVPGNGNFTDSRDGKAYRITRIGNHHWFAQNLEFASEGSKAPDTEKGGHYYNWQLAKDACPAGWELPPESLFKDLVPYTEELRLNPQFTGHYRKNENNVTREDEAMFWFADRNQNQQPFYFSLKQNASRPKRLSGDLASFKPVRCVKNLNTQPKDAAGITNDTL